MYANTFLDYTLHDEISEAKDDLPDYRPLSLILSSPCLDFFELALVTRAYRAPLSDPYVARRPPFTPELVLAKCSLYASCGDSATESSSTEFKPEYRDDGREA